MFSLTSSHRYYLYRNATDMRKNFDGLCGIVDGQLHRNPMSGEVFIFVNKRRNKVKLLHWEQGGFTLYYKRLEAGTLELPPLGSELSIPMQWSQLVMMIEGISLKSTTIRKRFSFKKSE
jgi:transposase